MPGIKTEVNITHPVIYIHVSFSKQTFCGVLFVKASTCEQQAAKRAIKLLNS